MIGDIFWNILQYYNHVHVITVAWRFFTTIVAVLPLSLPVPVWLSCLSWLGPLRYAALFFTLDMNS